MGKFEVVSSEHGVLSPDMCHRYLQTFHTRANVSDGAMGSINGIPCCIRVVNSITSPDGYTIMRIGHRPMMRLM
jgi:hypothetical protein